MRVNHGGMSGLLISRGGAIKRWKTKVVWNRIFGVSIHVWNSKFFVELSIFLGVFICMDEHTASEGFFDVARIMVRVAIGFKTSEVIKLEVDGIQFSLFLLKDILGPPMAGATGIFKTQNSGPESLDSDDYMSNEM